MVDMVRIAAVILILIADSAKLKNAVFKLFAEWPAHKRDIRKCTIEIMAVIMRTGGPIHYSFEAIHEAANLY